MAPRFEPRPLTAPPLDEGDVEEAEGVPVAAPAAEEPEDPPAEAVEDIMDASEAALEDIIDASDAALETLLAGELAAELPAELASDAGALEPPGQVAADGSVTPTVLHSC